MGSRNAPTCSCSKCSMFRHCGVYLTLHLYPYTVSPANDCCPEIREANGQMSLHVWPMPFWLEHYWPFIISLGHSWNFKWKLFGSSKLEGLEASSWSLSFRITIHCGGLVVRSAKWQWPNCGIPCHLFALNMNSKYCYTCILYLVLQSTPTHVKEMVVEWQGILHATHIQISRFLHWKQKAHPWVTGSSKNLVCKQSLTKVSGDENKTKAFIMSIQEQARHDFLPVSHESSFHKIVYILLAVSQLGCRSGRYVLS